MLGAWPQQCNASPTARENACFALREPLVHLKNWSMGMDGCHVCLPHVTAEVLCAQAYGWQAGLPCSPCDYTASSENDAPASNAGSRCMPSA